VGVTDPDNFFGRAPPPFGSKSTISRFVERFPDCQYSLLFFYSRCPRAQPFVKVGSRPSCPMESAPLGLSSIIIR